MSNPFLVSKPQFDVKTIKPGMAVSVSTSSGFNRNNKYPSMTHKPCIITKITPLFLCVAYYEEPKTLEEDDDEIEALGGKYNINTITLKAEDLADGIITLKPLVIEDTLEFEAGH